MEICKRSKSKTDIRLYTKQFYKGNKLCFMLSLCETLLGTVGALLVSWLLQQFVDLISGYGMRFTLKDLTIITLILIAGIAFANLISYYSKPKFITRGMAQYKEYIFGELTRKNIAAFSGENGAAYISALTNDIPIIERGYLRNTFLMMDSLLIFGGAILLMVWYSPLLTLVAVVLSLLPLMASVLTGNRIALAEKQGSDLNETYTSTLKDSLGGFSVIKSFKAEGRMLQIFKSQVQQLAEVQRRREKMQILIQLFGSVAGITAQLGVFIFGAYLALSGRGVTAGTTMVFLQLMNDILGPIETIPTCLAERKAARVLIEKTAAALGENVREEKEAEPIMFKESIRIKDLSFGYEPQNKVLLQINCTFEFGKKYAVVGASGSGKSTLLNLLTASHSDYEGEIFYDQRELRNISSESLYEIVSVIQQNVFIFNASIRDNITMFADFPREEVNRAIALSGLSDLIAERGEDYLCGENGSGLSGGEKQRISIARSLLKKSRVLLVDEATAALDPLTAFQISNAILNMDDLTGIVITHALDGHLLKRYDGLLALKNGGIAEMGTFEELMAKKGYFYSLYTVAQ